MKYLIYIILGLFLICDLTRAEIEVDTIENDLGASREGSRTDDEVVKREEEAIKLDGLNVAQMKELRDKAEKFTFQAEVNRMMKLIINSLYRNKEIFLRELISNASDALDKIRLLSLTDSSALDSNPELNIRIKADKTTNTLHITDSGIGMTRTDLVNNLGTIAKSGTAEFLNKMQDSADKLQDMNDLIGQFGVGFYSAFLVADKVIVTTKHNDDIQYIWESDASSFSIVEDPRGPTLKRGTTITLQLKPEAQDFSETETIKNLVKKYSQFINFPIYLWNSKTVEVEEAEEDDKEEQDKTSESEDEAQVEEEQEDKPKTKKVEKTIWDWEVLNDSKPIWTRKPNEISDSEYNEFYKALTKDSSEPLTKIHFVAEGEVTFKSVLFVPKNQPSESFNRYGTKTDNIKLFVRRVFITDSFPDIFPNYLSFIQGVVDSDDLPLNVSREDLQQHKLIKVIKKKLVRKALDMMKKIPREEYEKFWKEYSTNIKLGVIEDPSNRTRLAKLLMFFSSSDSKLSTLSEYVSRMKPNQEKIYYIAGTSLDDLKSSPFTEQLLAKNYEILYLVDAVDEYCISALPDFEGKKFQNIAKEGLTIAESDAEREAREQLVQTYQPLVSWLGGKLGAHISKAEVSERLKGSPCALVASMFGWTGNMERLAVSNAHQKSDDPQRSYYLNQKKTLEINPHHPLIIELLRRVESNPEDPIAVDTANILFRTATLRSGYLLKDTQDFASDVERLLKKSLGLEQHVEEEDDEDVHQHQEYIDEEDHHDEL